MRHTHHHMMHLEIMAPFCNLLVHVTATLASTIDIFVPNQIISFSCSITNIMDHPTNFSHHPGQESNFLSRTICLTSLPLDQFSCKSIARATRKFSPIDLASSPSPPCKMNSCMVFWSHLKSMAEIVVLFLFVNRKDEKRRVLM